MPLLYHRLLRQIGLRTNSLRGDDEVDLETTYKSTTLTEDDFIEGADFPFTAHKDALVNGEELLAGVISSQKDAEGFGNHPWRSSLHSTTPLINSGSTIPSVDLNGIKIVGAYGSVRDDASGQVLTYRPVEVIRRINAETWRTYPLHHFCREGTRLYHTRTLTGARFDVCVYDRATQATAIDNNGTVLLPDAAEPAYISAALSFLSRDEAFAKQAAEYATRLVMQLQTMTT